MKRQDGFSMVEMVVVTSISSIVVLLLGMFIANALRTYTREQTKTILQSNTKIAVEVVARDIRAASNIENNNTEPDNNAPGAPGNLYSWASTSGPGSTLVLSIPARTATDDLIFIDGLHNNLYRDNVVYYLDNSTSILYKRVIKNTAAPGNVAVTTCPSSSATPACPSDAKVVEDVADLNVTYYDANNNVTATPSSAFSARITLKQTQVKGGITYSSDYTTNVSLRNR